MVILIFRIIRRFSSIKEEEEEEHPFLMKSRDKQTDFQWKPPP
jgi:hypothetical protein